LHIGRVLRKISGPLSQMIPPKQAEQEVTIHCHQCEQPITYDQVAHRDIYSDVCWIQCKDCEKNHGIICGVSVNWNRQRHGYFDCPFIRAGVRVHKEPGQLPV
jgi:hypothetical protein